MTLARRILPAIDPARCTGCGRCVSACPPRLFTLEPRGWRKISVMVADEDCTGCAKCAVECPVHAISMRKYSDHQGAGLHGYNSISSPIDATHADLTGKPE